MERVMVLQFSSIPWLLMAVGMVVVASGMDAANIQAVNQSVPTTASGSNSIPKLVKPQNLYEKTSIVHVNGTYFKGQWKTQFPKDATRINHFYTNETNYVRVDTMQLCTEMLYGYYTELDARAVSLPYEDNRSSMLILLPNERTGLAKLEKKLAFFSLERILQNMTTKSVRIQLPKFKVKSTINLKGPLPEFALGNLFNSRHANLSGILEEKYSVQNTVIEVSEEGSGAPDGTTGAQSEACHPGVGYPGEVLAKHPFIAIIFGKPLNTFLLMARVLNPIV